MSKIWNDQQKAIFNWSRSGSGNLLVRARAGSGKTTTIIEAIQYAAERSIMLCAFNTEIANELSRRLTNPNAQARTLHSIGNGVIYKNMGKVQVSTDRGKLLAKKALSTTVKGRTPSSSIIHTVRDLAAKAKNLEPFCLDKGGKKTLAILEKLAETWDLRPSKDDALAGWDDAMIVQAAGKALALAIENDGTIDFDDMIWLPVANRWARPRYDLIVVDEAQDMNACQLELAIMSARGRIAVVGDDCQAIYAFRGANSDTLDILKKRLSAKELGLTITYRCPKRVVALANDAVPDLIAAPTAPEGTIDNIAHNEMIAQAGPGNFVLSRSNAPLAKICLAFVRAGKRAIIRGREFGDRLIRIIEECRSENLTDFNTNLGIWRERMIDSLMAQGEDVSEDKLELVADQVETIRELTLGLTSTSELIARIRNFFTADKTSDQSLGAAITCSTVHKAKGLETERVFLITSSFNRKRKSKEEMNIWYVAVTRTKSHLTWVGDAPSKGQE